MVCRVGADCSISEWDSNFVCNSFFFFFGVRSGGRRRQKRNKERPGPKWSERKGNKENQKKENWKTRLRKRSLQKLWQLD